MFNKLKQFKDLREKAKTIQAALAAESAEGTAAWGKVKITVDGTQHVMKVEIDQSVMDDKTKLEGYIKDATNDGMEKIQKIMATKMKDIGGMDLAKEIGEMMNGGDKE